MSWSRNVKAWAAGWGQEPPGGFKPGWGWSSPKWLLHYGFNYGTRTLTGGACISWSRWFYLNRDRLGSAGFATRLLNRLDPKHGEKAGPALWGTEDTDFAAAGAVIFWSVVLAGLAWIIWKVLA